MSRTTLRSNASVIEPLEDRLLRSVSVAAAVAPITCTLVRPVFELPIADDAAAPDDTAVGNPSKDDATDETLLTDDLPPTDDLGELVDPGEGVPISWISDPILIDEPVFHIYLMDPGIGGSGDDQGEVTEIDDSQDSGEDLDGSDVIDDSDEIDDSDWIDESDDETITIDDGWVDDVSDTDSDSNTANTDPTDDWAVSDDLPSGPISMDWVRRFTTDDTGTPVFIAYSSANFLAGATEPQAVEDVPSIDDRSTEILPPAKDLPAVEVLPVDEGSETLPVDDAGGVAEPGIPTEPADEGEQTPLPADAEPIFYEMTSTDTFESLSAEPQPEEVAVVNLSETYEAQIADVADTTEVPQIAPPVTLAAFKPTISTTQSQSTFSSLPTIAQSIFASKKDEWAV